MFYLALISSSFRKSSLEELNRVAEFRIVDEFVATLVIESKEKKFAERLLESNPIFVYNIFPLESRSDIKDSDYLNSLYRSIGKLPANKGIKVECFDVNCKTEYSAKDIEVNIGQRWEKEKYDVNIVKPDILVYLVMINNHCYSGSADYKKLSKKFVNPERYYHQYSKDSISRSELKLIQAFDEFGIKGKGIAIDIGAAPGGWSDFLVKSGFKVIAIDNGELDYKKFKESGIKVKVLEKSPSKEDLKSNQIIHIKSNASKLSLKGVGKINMIVNDMNMDPRDSAKILLQFSSLLSKDAKLVMTVKCVDRKAEKHLANAREALKGRFKFLGVKVLPSDRQELTIYAKAV